MKTINRIAAPLQLLLAVWCLVDFARGEAWWNLLCGLALLIFAVGNFYFGWLVDRGWLS